MNCFSVLCFYLMERTCLLSCPKARRWCFTSVLGFQRQRPWVSRSSGSTWLLHQAVLWTQRGQVDSFSCRVWFFPESKERPLWSSYLLQMFAPHSVPSSSTPLSNSSFLNCLPTSFSFQPWVGWFTLFIKSQKKQGQIFFAAGNTKPF